MMKRPEVAGLAPQGKSEGDARRSSETLGVPDIRIQHEGTSTQKPGHCSIETIPDPRVADGEILLKVRLVGFCGSDLNSFRGLNPLVSYPRILGHEVSATVVEGDSVLSPGTDVALSPYTSCGTCASCRRGRRNACQFYQKVAGYFLTGTLAAFGVGRFSSAWLMRFVAPARLLGSYAILNVVLVAFAILRPGWSGLWALFATSFFMSLMFPTIFALGLKGLGPNTKIGGSLIVMAIVGGAVLTPVMGLIAEARHSIAPAYGVPLIAYVVIAAYAFAGAKTRSIDLTMETLLDD